MLIETKVKVIRINDGKARRLTETYITDKELFSEAEYAVMAELTKEQDSKLVESFEIQSLRVSPIKELYAQNEGECEFIATLKDFFHDDNGTEKTIKYKVLLWADSLNEAVEKAQEIMQQGYDMSLEGLKEVDYICLEEDVK